MEQTSITVTEFERRHLNALRVGDRRDYYLRRDVRTGAITVVSWWTTPDGGIGERRITCTTMAQVKAEITRILENKQAVADIVSKE